MTLVLKPTFVGNNCLASHVTRLSAVFKRKLLSLYDKTLQIKLAQWSLIKIIFPLEGSPILASIYVRSVAFLKSFLEAQ